MSDNVVIALIAGAVVVVLGVIALLHPGLRKFRAKILGGEVSAEATRAEARAKDIQAGGSVRVTTESAAGKASGAVIRAEGDVDIHAGKPTLAGRSDGERG